MNIQDDINTWREVHLRLSLAIASSHDNISKELATRRYLLEEITRCKALTVTPAKKNETKVKKKPSVKKEEEPKKAAEKHTAKKCIETAVKKPPHKKLIIPKPKIETKVKQAPKCVVKPNPKPNPISSETARALISIAQGMGEGGTMLPGHGKKLQAVIGSGRMLEDAMNSMKQPKSDPAPPEPK
ncbi:hypothetical protein ACHAXN_007261 [Cyclotella atomus]|jgi:hypothetical protein